MQSIFNAEIKVYEYLIQLVEERRAEIEEDTPNIEITDEEEEVLKQMKEFDWKADLQDLEKMYQSEDIDFVDVGTELEEKEVIRFNEDDLPKPKAKLEELKAAGEVVL